jgi:phosphoglycolate phosphatase-like HAD superfamily hydrolase
MIGDAASDAEAAARAGCRGAIVVHPGRAAPSHAPHGAVIAADVAAAAAHILAAEGE